jgi:hypothetical protein
MEKQDLNNLKLPLTKDTFKVLRKAIRNGKIKWMDMSKDLMYAYQDFWRFDKYKNYQ